MHQVKCTLEILMEKIATQTKSFWNRGIAPNSAASRDQMLVVKRISMTSFGAVFINIAHLKIWYPAAQLLSFRNEKAIWPFWQSVRPEPGYLVTCSFSGGSQSTNPPTYWPRRCPNRALFKSMKRIILGPTSPRSAREIFHQICGHLSVYSQLLTGNFSMDRISFSIKSR